MTRSAGDDRLVRLTEICLALPEAGRQEMGDHAAFTVRDKKFAYFLSDHHGDGIVWSASGPSPASRRSCCPRTPPGSTAGHWPRPHARWAEADLSKRRWSATAYAAG